MNDGGLLILHPSAFILFMNMPTITDSQHAPPSTTTLRAVAFDLWETLITNTPELTQRQQRLRLDRLEGILAARGLAAAERIEHAYRHSWHRCHELYWSADRDVPCRRQIEHFLEGLDLDPHALDRELVDELEEAYANVALEILPSLMPGALEAVRTLKSRQLRIGLISNTGRTPGVTLRRILDRVGLGPFMDVMVFSDEHGHCKPRASIFEELRLGLGVACGEMVFVGDNLYADVHGAQRCGMRGIHFDAAVRGTAVAPDVDHGLTIVPDATIRELHELPSVLAQWVDG
jgi:putative hydrolase of the HAD superfamily